MTSVQLHAPTPGGPVLAESAASPPAVSPLDCERLGDQIAELASRIQAATYELLVLIRQFDEQAGWNHGFVSCAHWLTWRTGLAPGAAREKVRVARALADLPHLSAAMQRGEISYSKVRAITRVATAENEKALLGFALAGTAAHVEKLVRAWRRVDRNQEAQEDERRYQHRELKTWVDDDGMLVIRGRLTPEVGAVVRRALDAAAERLYQESADTPAPETQAEEVTHEQRRADALGLVAESALAADLDPGTAADRYQVVLHVDEAGLSSDAELTAPRQGQSVLEETCQHVPAGTSRRLACDAATVVIRHGEDGSVLDVGRKTRTIPPAIRRALSARDRSCRFPGCAARRCDAHHIQHWAEGGKTCLDNLVLLCRRHHRALHEGGFTLSLAPDGTAVFSRPDGRPLGQVPAPPAWEGSPLAPIERRLAHSGVSVGPHTAAPAWRGERFDLDWAVDLLWVPKPREASGDVPAGTSPPVLTPDLCPAPARGPESTL